MNTTAPQTPAGEEHYLKRELYDLLARERSVMEFLHADSVDGMWFWDLERPEHEWMSPGFWRVFGYDASEKQHLASEWMDMIHPDDLRLAQQNARVAMADPEARYDQIVRYRHRDGTTVWVRCRGLILRDDDGRATRMLGAHSDLTNFKRAEELRRQNEALDLFTRLAAHDFQAPLRHIRYFLDVAHKARQDSSPEALAEALAGIEKSEERLAELCDGLLEYAQLDLSNTRLQTLSLRKVVDQALERMEPELRSVGADWRVHGSWPELHGASALLVQLFENLVSNSIKYRSADRPLELALSCTRELGSCVVRVVDNGVGFPPEEAKRILAPLTRLVAPAQVPGLGLGLAMCVRIAGQHRGTLEALGRPGEGAEFIVRLPLSIEEEVQA